MDIASRDRAIAFLSALEDACAETVLECPGGQAILDSRHPLLWSANHLRVRARQPPDAADLDAAARTHLGALAFRMITARDGPVGRALTEPLAALGYRCEHELLMVMRATTAAPDPRAHDIVEVTVAELEASRVAAQIEAGRDGEVARQLTSRDALVGAAVASRRLAFVADGEIAARCQIYSDGPVTQIENVYTDPRHRRRGLASALILHAAHQAQGDGAELVFLVTDARDGPQALYRRLGFGGAGLLHRFRRAALA